MAGELLTVLIFLTIPVFAFFSAFLKKLTVSGAITGALTAACIFAGTGIPGLSSLAIFFIAATAATAFHSRARPAESHQPRNALQVLANGGMAAVLSLTAIVLPEHLDLLGLMVAGSLTAAVSDTVSSELGMVYGKRFYNILSFKREEKGMDGLISIEGTVAGVAATLLIALPYAGLTANTIYVPVLVVAGMAGNIADSLLGASLERRQLLGNDAVNFLNTFTGAMVAGLLITWLT